MATIPTLMYELKGNNHFIVYEKTPEGGQRKIFSGTYEQVRNFYQDWEQEMALKNYKTSCFFHKLISRFKKTIGWHSSN